MKGVSIQPETWMKAHTTTPSTGFIECIMVLVRYWGRGSRGNARKGTPTTEGTGIMESVTAESESTETKGAGNERKRKEGAPG